MGETVWRGTTMDDRAAERRRQLLDVCLDTVSAGGAASVTLRGICRSARLSPRYLYENFSGREELLIATYDHVEEGLLERLVQAGQGRPTLSIRTVLETCAEYFDEDPRRARILLREPMSDETLRAHQAGKAPVFIRTLVPALDSTDSRDAPRDAQELGVLAAALSGALVSLYLEWIDGRLDIDREALADSATRLVTAIARASRRPR